MTSSIKIRTSTRDGVTTVRALIRHPMEFSRDDPVTGETTPAHFIKEVICQHNGTTVMTANWGVGVSKNPYLSFRFSGSSVGDKLTLTWIDSRGETDTLETAIS